jgi:hypothetical protein
VEKLKMWDVLGLTCDEFLGYARENRLEWERSGRDIVRELVESAENCWEIESDPST